MPFAIVQISVANLDLNRTFSVSRVKGCHESCYSTPLRKGPLASICCQTRQCGVYMAMNSHHTNVDVVETVICEQMLHTLILMVSTFFSKFFLSLQQTHETNIFLICRRAREVIAVATVIVGNKCENVHVQVETSRNSYVSLRKSNKPPIVQAQAAENNKPKKPQKRNQTNNIHTTIKGNKRKTMYMGPEAGNLST